MSELAALFEDPARVAEIPPDRVPALLGEIERLRATLWARLTTPAGGNGQPDPPAEDRLLSVTEAAEKLGLTEDYLYRHAKTLPFTVRVGPRQLRFSLRGIERYIRQRQGR